MNTLPRHDIARAEIDNLFAKHFASSDNFKLAHKRFAKAVKEGFSRLTECAAIAYAKVAYHADIENIEQYYNVERNGWDYDVVLITAETGAKSIASKQVQGTFKCVEKAMHTCLLLNSLFKVELS